jgi:uncharacterized OB-fold protein
VTDDLTLPRPEPIVTPETKPYWDGTIEGSLTLPRCDDCGFVIWYPRSFCPACGSADVSWFAAEPRGTIYSFTICHRGSGEYRGHEPYVLAYVELESGPRVLTNLLVTHHSSLTVGAAVEAVFDATGPTGALLRFRLTDASHDITQHT